MNNTGMVMKHNLAARNESKIRAGDEIVQVNGRWGTGDKLIKEVNRSLESITILIRRPSSRSSGQKCGGNKQSVDEEKVRRCLEVLGLTMGTAAAEVRSRFRSLMRTLHPDKHMDRKQTAAEKGCSTTKSSERTIQRI